MNPDLVVRDEQDAAYSVRYEAVNAMLLNEFLKEHTRVEDKGRKDQEQEALIAKLQFTVAQQQKEIQMLTASLKEQASQIRKVSEQLAMSKPALQLAANELN